MKRGLFLCMAVALMPAAVHAQADPMERLAQVLPEAVRERVLAQIEAARSRDLPEQAMASLALEGVAKGRGSEEVLAAVESMLADMGRAQDALQSAGHSPAEGEIEAATAAMRMGVDANAVGELARSGPSGRSLAVPLLVLGNLTERGLSSDEALDEVRDRLAARASDADLVRAFPETARGLGLGRGIRPEPGTRGPPAEVPLGPPSGRGRPDVQGRGGGPGD